MVLVPPSSAFAGVKNTDTTNITPTCAGRAPDFRNPEVEILFRFLGTKEFL